MSFYTYLTRIYL